MYAHLDKSGNIVGTFAGPQPAGTPNYAVIDDNDPLVAAYNASVVSAPLVAQAEAELAKSDMVAIRCAKAGISYPANWQTRDTALRAIVNNGTGTIPKKPAYPAGT